MLAPIFLLAVCLAGNVLADDDLVVGIDKMVPFGNSGSVAFSRARQNRLAYYEDGHWKAWPIVLSKNASAQPRSLHTL